MEKFFSGGVRGDSGCETVEIIKSLEENTQKILLFGREVREKSQKIDDDKLIEEL